MVALGADPQQIEFDVRDEDRTSALNGGELTLHTKAGNLRLQAPVAYQVMGRQRKPVAASYQAAGSGHIGFRVGAYDSRYPLIIDPVLVYSAVFGGSYEDLVEGLAIDTAQNVYVTGVTYSTDFPLAHPYQSAPGDRYRQVYVSGYTTSPDFPLKSPIQGYTGTNAAPSQGFVTTLSSSLSSIQYYSTYFGSETSSNGYFAGNKVQVKIAVDRAP